MLLTGLALGAVYDLFRQTAKYTLRAVRVLLDLCFCAIVLLALFSLGMGVGQGRLQIWMPFAAALGAAVYFALFGSIFRSALDAAAHLMAKIGRKLLAPVKKLQKTFKKLFSTAKKWFTIIQTRFTIILSSINSCAAEESHEAE